MSEPVVDIGVKRERKEAAEALLDEKGVFMLAVRMLRKEWFGEMMGTESDRTADRLRFQLRALEAIPETLQRFITDYKFALDKQKKHG